MSDIYSLRLYNTELMRFSLEKRGLDGLVANIISVQEEYAPLMPLDLEQTSEGIIRWLSRRIIPKNRTFVDQILKTLNLSHNDTKGIIDVCKGLSLNDSYWVVPEGFEGTFEAYDLYLKFWRWWPTLAQNKAMRRSQPPPSLPPAGCFPKRGG